MQNGDIFWGLLKFLIVMGVFEVPDIFWVVKGGCWGPSLCMQKKLEYPPSPWDFDLGAFLSTQ